MSIPADRKNSDIAVCLRPMREEDCGMVVRWRNQDRVRMNHVYREYLSEEEEREYFRNKVIPGEYIHLIACSDDEDRTPFGCVIYHDYDREAKSVEGGLFIGEEFALGRGLGPRMLELGADRVREILDIRTVTAKVFEDNLASLAAHARAGYIPCGRLDGVRCTDGEVKPMILMEKRCDAH